MSNYVKVSVPRIKSDADRLHVEVDKIPNFITELDAAMKDLGTCWEGPAWIAFQHQVEEDILNMLNLYDWFRVYMKAMADAAKIYGESEKKSYDCVDKVRI